MKKITSLLLAISINSIAMAQSLERQIIASAGNYNNNAAGSLSATLGEPVTNTFITGSFAITQGFQQPQQSDLKVDGPVQVNVTYELYPNPATNSITLSMQLDNAATIALMICDVTGRIMLQPESVDIKTNSYKREFDIARFPQGNYFLKIVSPSGNIYTALPFTKY